MGLKDDISISGAYIIEREFLGKITIEELVGKIIKIHIENNENQIKKK